MEVEIEQATGTLLQLIKAALAGEDVYLVKDGERVAQFTASTVPKPRNGGGLTGRGCWAGKVNLYEGWDSPEEDKRVQDMFECLKNPE